MALLILLEEVITIKTFYIKQGQNSMYKRIKIKNNSCTIHNLSEKTKITKVEKIVKKLSELGVKSVIISKSLHENENFINALKFYNITIFDGKWLGQYILEEIIQYIETRKIKFKKDEISILANDLTEEVKGNIKDLINKFKRIKIVTNHGERFKKLEKDLYEQNGVSIIISNNKKKSLSKSEVIINFDFIEEEINKYAIHEKAIILTLNEKIKVKTKRFNGIIITDYEVGCSDMSSKSETQIENFYNKEILEEKIYNESLKRVQLSEANCSKFEVIKNILKEYKIIIESIYGKNGILL